GAGAGAASTTPTHLVELMRWLADVVESVLALLKEETKVGTYQRAFGYVANHMLYGTLLVKDEPSLNLKAEVNFLFEK
ncbi:unnamed protein product, partial [Tilletia laevis]